MKAHSITKRFSVFVESRPRKPRKTISWGLARNYCCNRINVIANRDSEVKSEWKFYVSECIKQINDVSYQWSVREYKQIFFLCEYINTVAIEIKECHLYQVAALKLSQEINNAPRQQRRANKALNATTWSRALDFANNINNIKPTKHNDQGWGLAQRYCSDRMKASKANSWSVSIQKIVSQLTNH